MRNIQFFLFFVLICFFVLPFNRAYAETFMSGEISHDSVWTAEEGPYVIDSLLTVLGGKSLVIEEGVHVSFTNQGNLRILGIFDVRGTAHNPVIFDSNTHVHISDGRVSFSHARFEKPLRLYVEKGTFLAENVHLDRLEDIFSSQSSVTFTSSSINSGRRIFLENDSTASFDGVSIKNFDAFGSVFMVFGTSSVSIRNSHIEPVSAAFAHVQDESIFSVSSSTISHMKEWGIRAFGNSFVSLRDVSMSDITADGFAPAPFVGLWESSADIIQSSFKGTPQTALVLFGSESRRSHLTLEDSFVEEYGESGLFALLSDVYVGYSVFRDGKKGIESVDSHISLTRSSLTNHSEYAAFAHNPDFSIFALNNFWGDESGPHHDVFNPNGIGDLISDNVEFVPWLKKDPRACCSSIMFLPGLQASRLYVKEGGEENRLWEPNRDRDVELLNLNQNGSGGKHVYVKERDVVEEIYGVAPLKNIYKSFLNDMEMLKATGTISDWLPVAYDWRLSFDTLLNEGLHASGTISYITATSSPYIMQELKRLAESSKTGRVTIVAHSNGGLLAKALVQKLEELSDEEVHIIDKIILVATPQTGTPKAVTSLLHGFEEGMLFVFSAKVSRALGLTMPSAHVLVPSYAYTILNSRPLIQFDATSTLAWIKKRRDLYTSKIQATSKLFDFMKGGDGRKQADYNDLASPSIVTASLMDKAIGVHNELDTWLPPVGIRLIQIAGWGIDTVSGIQYYEGVKKKKPVLLYKPLLASDGDGTVMMNSAWALTVRDNIFAYWINLREAARGWNKNRKHADIFEVPELRELLKDLITLRPDFIPRRRYVSAEEKTPLDTEKKIRVFLHAPDASLHVYDTKGNHTGISSDTGLVEEHIPHVTYDEFGEVVYVTVPESGTHIVVTNPGGNEDASEDQAEDPSEDPSKETSFVIIEIDEVVGDTVATSTSWSDVPVAASTTVHIDIDSIASSTPVLEIDEDGDGEIDFEVKPDVPGVFPDVTVEEEKVENQSSRSGSRRNEQITVQEPIVISLDPLPVDVAAPPLMAIVDTAVDAHVISADIQEPESFIATDISIETATRTSTTTATTTTMGTTTETVATSTILNKNAATVFLSIEEGQGRIKFLWLILIFLLFLLFLFLFLKRKRF